MLEEQLPDPVGCLHSPSNDQDAGKRLPACCLRRAVVHALPYILVIRVAALAADMIRRLKSQYLKQNLATPKLAALAVKLLISASREMVVH